MALFNFMVIDYSRPGQIADRFNVSIKVLGRLELLDEKLRKNIELAEERTRGNTNGRLNFCVAYTSRDEICRAMKETVHQCCGKGLPVESITDGFLSAQMDVAGDSIPVDILVRTSRVQRLSDFLLWQCHQDTNIQVVDVHWPDFDMWQLFLVILRWQRKKDGFQVAKIPYYYFSSVFFSCIVIPILVGSCTIC